MSTPRQTPVALALGTAQTIGWGSSYYLPAILAVPMARDLGVSPSAVFAAFSAGLIVSALLGPAAGGWIDRRGGRGALTASNLIFAAGLGGLALAQGPVAMTAAWLAIGVGMACGLYEAAFATLAGLYGRAARRPITLVTLIAGFASTVSWPVTAWIEAEQGWRAACLFWAAAHLLIALPLNRLIAAPPPPTAAAAPPPPAGDGGAVWPLALMAWAFAATWIVSTAMATHLPLLLQAAGAAPAAAIAAAALVGPAQVAARLAEFALMRRAPPALSAQIACLAHPLGAVALTGLGPVAAPAFTLLHGAGNGVMTIAKGTLPLSYFGPAGYGLRQGWLAAPARFGQAVAPLGFALLLEAFGAAALIASSALMLSAWLALRLLPPQAAAGQ